jgi:hypothetical protein
MGFACTNPGRSIAAGSVVGANNVRDTAQDRSVSTVIGRSGFFGGKALILPDAIRILSSPQGFALCSAPPPLWLGDRN